MCACVGALEHTVQGQNKAPRQQEPLWDGRKGGVSVAEEYPGYEKVCACIHLLRA